MALRPGGAHARRRGDPIICDETLEPFDPTNVQSGDVSASASTPATRCAATKSGGMARAARRMGRLRRHPRDALPRRSPRARRGARGRQGRRRSDLGQGHRRLQTGTPQSDLRRGPRRRRVVRCRRAGTCCRRTATCGHRSRPSAAARSIARSARCGARTGRSRGSAAVDKVVERNRRAAAARLPVHRAGRRQLLSRLADRPRDGGAAQRPARLRDSRRCARSDSS